MATNFPASLDALTNPTSSDSLSSPSHSAQHANVNDAVEALQAKVGADSSAVVSSLDYKVAQLEAISHGKILQVVSTTKTDTFSTSSTSLTNITGLSITITPSATSSKILIFLSLSQIGMNADNWFFGDITRGGTPIGVGDAAGSRTQSSWAASTTGANRPDNCNWHFLDSPNTTSATTYQARVRVAGNTVYINRHSVDTDSPGYPRSVSSITALEVSA
jgi:hypothetical protein